MRDGRRRRRRRKRRRTTTCWRQREEAAPAPAMPPLASLLPDYYCDNFISKVRRRTDRALTTYVSCRGREKNFEAGSWWHAIFDKLVWRGEGIRAAFVNVNLLLFPSRI